MTYLDDQIATEALISTALADPTSLASLATAAQQHDEVPVARLA